MNLITVFEIIGTAAFAASGATVAIGKQMDIFGVAILGMTTAVGGGMLRDVLINAAPPSALVDPLYALMAVLVSLILFSSSVRRKIARGSEKKEVIMLIADSIGLGVFTMLGAEKAYTAIPDVNVFTMVFLGCITGVGGGVLRDVFAGNRPYIFVKHFYATACIIGALVFSILRPHFGQSSSMLLGGAVTLVLRLMAAHYRWSLPRAS